MDDDRTRWNRRFREEGWPEQPSPYLLSVSAHLPCAGRALDLAGGPGRNAVWLAERGLDVTLVDVSPVALEMAHARAVAAGVALRLVAADLEAEPLPAGPWQVVAWFHYLARPLFPVVAAALTPGGWLVCELATVRNLERHHRPPAPYLLEEGELATLVDELDIVELEEGWFEDRHQARLLARRPSVRTGQEPAPPP